MLMSKQQCDLYVNRLRNAPNVFSGLVTWNSRGALVFCASGMNTGTVNVDREGIEVSAEQAKTLTEAGAGDLYSRAPDVAALVAALVDEFLPRLKAAPPNQRARVMQEFQVRAQRLPGDGAKLATQELLKRLQARGAVGSGAGRPIR